MSIAVTESRTSARMLGVQQAENAAIDRCEMAAAAEIRDLFAGYWQGRPTYLPYSNSLGRDQAQPAIDAITDALTSGAPRDALEALLQGKGTVDQLRAALVADYVGRNADQLGYDRAMREPLPAWMARAAA